MCIGVSVSGSRSAVASCALVIASLAVVFVFRRDALNRFSQVLLAVVLLGLILSRTAIFQEGVNVLTTRFNEVAEQTQESVARGIVGRVWSEFTESAYVWAKAPTWGYGLGIGTNAGANILTGHSMFLLTEGEWSRIVLESGKILGLAYIFWRVALTGYIGIVCIRALKLGNLLPLFLFSAGAVSMVNGQFGQPTILGFAVVTLGLTLAATKEEGMDPAAEEPVEAIARPVARTRSAFAERLHGPKAGSSGTNVNGFRDH